MSDVLRTETNQVAAENDRLQATVDELGDTVKELEVGKDDLKTQTQNQKLEAHAKHVEENRESAMGDIVRKEADQVAAQNANLLETKEKLADTAEKLEAVGNNLQTQTQTQNQNIEAHAKQVEESKEVLNKMESNLQEAKLKNFLCLVGMGNKDGDFEIGDSDMEHIIKGVRAVGVEINEESFREGVKKRGGSLNAVIQVVNKKISKCDDDETREIFKDPSREVGA